jgi:two-component system response regulator FixJ
MATVYVVDDDSAMLESLTYLFQAEGFGVEQCRSGGQLLERTNWSRPACMVIDLRLIDIDGLELRRRLRDRGIDIPTIIISGRAEIPDAVRAVKDGVLDFLTKPFDDTELIQRIRQAMTQDEENLRQKAEMDELRQRFSRLTSRESEVLRCVLEGMANKQIAVTLCLSPKTVEFHRKHVMEKIEVDTVTELVRLSALLFPELRSVNRKK